MKKGDRVYHKNLKRYGTFVENDWANEEFCFVDFGNDDVKCVSFNQLRLIEKRKCSSLKNGEQVVFKIYSDILERKTPMDGTVIYVKNNKVCVSYLYGYQSRTDDIPFEDMLAVYNPKGELMHFENIHWCSNKLIAE